MMRIARHSFVAASIVFSTGCYDWDRFSEACPGNLLPNGGFEGNMEGWAPPPDGGTFERVPEGHGGTYAARICMRKGAIIQLVPGQGLLYSAAFEKLSVSQPSSSEYALSAWTRSDPSLPQLIQAELSAQSNVGVQMLSTPPSPLTPSWTQLVLRQTVSGAGAFHLSGLFQATVNEQPDMNAPPETLFCFELDSVCLQAATAN